MMQIPQWTVFETAVQSVHHYDNPFWDVTVQVELTAPSGRQHVVDAFWDGAHTWRLRFCPDKVGEWQWTFTCSDAADAGLSGPQGSFRCVPYVGDNPLYQRGPVRLSAGRTHFVHANGDLFFWLSDTAWNGVLRSREVDWDRYLRTRRQQGFTAVQFVSTQWRGCTRDPFGEAAFMGLEHIRLQPRFFQRLDSKVAAINERGLVAAPVLLWALWESDPGQALAEADATRLVRYLVARWGAHQVIWFLGGDGNYVGQRSERWKRIGNAVFGGRHDRLVTTHPCGQTWVGDEFRGESWFDFIGYQSGHGSSPDHLRWLVDGPPAREWRKAPSLPVVNLEPNYETHPSYHVQRKFADYEVRRAAYWSLLVAPTAGVTYGHNAIWVWAQKPEVPEGHERIGIVEPWYQGLYTPGVQSMSILRRFFDSLPWSQLRPAPELLVEQRGAREPHRFVAAAKTADDVLAVLYLPKGGEVRLDLASLKRPASARWFDPRSDVWVDVGGVTEEMRAFTAPDEGDWVLCIGELG